MANAKEGETVVRFDALPHDVARYLKPLVAAASKVCEELHRPLYVTGAYGDEYRRTDVSLGDIRRLHEALLGKAI